MPRAFLWLCRGQSEEQGRKPNKMRLLPGKGLSPGGRGQWFAAVPEKGRFTSSRIQDRLCTTVAAMLVPWAGTDPTSREPPSYLGSSAGTWDWKGPGAAPGKVRGVHTGQVLEHLVALSPTAPQAPAQREQPRRFCKPYASSICFWGTFVPDLSPVSWSYYKQVQSALPLLFR